MSVIHELGDDYINLPAILQRYEREFASITQHLKMKGIALDQLLIEQPSWVGHYQIRKSELKSIRKHIESSIDRVRGKLWKHFTEKYPRELNYRDKEHYINHDEYLCDLRDLFHSVSELEDKYDAACEALQQRGFMLNALVKSKTGGFDSIVL